MFNPAGIAVFIFCLTAVVMVAVFAGVPAIWWALAVWAVIVMIQVL